MAKCTITIEDGENDDETKVSVVFEPMVKPGKPMTEAQEIGWAIAQKMAKAAAE